MGKTAIEWTDATWNPTIGCTRVSAGCENCYAEKRAYRNAAMGNADYRGLTRKHGDGSVNWTGEVRMLAQRLEQPLHWKKPRRVFVDSMSDLFHEKVSDEYVARVFAVMAAARKHTFQVLTKRPERMADLLGGPSGQWLRDSVFAKTHQLVVEATTILTWPLPNVWLGVSVEDQAAADERIPLLLQTPAAVRFLSIEPLLGPIDLGPWLGWPAQIPIAELHWVIVGGESGGPKGRRLTYWDRTDWVRAIRDRCHAAQVPFFFKQWGGPTPKSGGRLLDGRTWSQFPDGRGGIVEGAA